MANYELVENPFDGVDSPMTILSKIAMRSFNASTEGSRGYRTKMASANPELVEQALNDSYLEGFFGAINGTEFTKEASYNTERIVASELGSQLGMEFLLNMKDSLQGL